MFRGNPPSFSAKSCKRDRHWYVVTKAEKSSYVVGLDTINYVDKVKQFLSFDSFKIIPRNPTTQFMNKLKSVIDDSVDTLGCFISISSA